MISIGAETAAWHTKVSQYIAVQRYVHIIRPIIAGFQFLYGRPIAIKTPTPRNKAMFMWLPHSTYLLGRREQATELSASD